MEMQIEIAKTILEMIKTGGAYGLWGLTIYLAVALVKFLMLLIAFIYVVERISKIVNAFIIFKAYKGKRNYALISKEASCRLISFLEEMEKNQEELFKDIGEKLDKSDGN